MEKEKMSQEKMNKEKEIVDTFINRVRNMATLSDETLRKIISELIEKDPEQLDILEKLLYKKEMITLTTLTFAQSTKFADDKSNFRETGTEINIYVEHDSLSTDELKKLLQCIREIEQNNVERDIKIWMNTPEKTVEEMENIMNSIQPVCAHKMVVKGPNYHTRQK